MVSKKRKIKKRSFGGERFPLIISIIFFVLIVGFLAFSNFKIYYKRVEMKEKIGSLEKEIQFLEEKNEQLKSGIFDAETDVYWEARLYEQGYKKPGEEAIVILPPEKKEELVVPEEKAFFDNLLDWILRRE